MHIQETTQKLKLAAVYIIFFILSFAFIKFQYYINHLAADIYINLLLVLNASVLLSVIKSMIIALFVTFFAIFTRSMAKNRKPLLYIISGVSAILLTLINNHVGRWIWGANVTTVLQIGHMFAMAGGIQIFIGILIKMNVNFKFLKST